MAKTFGKKDKWKLKKKYSVILPENFGSKNMGFIVSSDPKNLINRRITYTIRDIVGDKQKQHINVAFKVEKVDGDRCLTRFDRLSVDRKYLMSRIVPGHTVIDQPFIIKIKDARLRVAVNVLTAYKIHAAQKRDMIKRIPLVLEGYKNEELDKFVNLAIAGNISAEIFKNLKKIAPIRRVEIREMNVKELFQGEKEVMPESKISPAQENLPSETQSLLNAQEISAEQQSQNSQENA